MTEHNDNELNTKIKLFLDKKFAQRFGTRKRNQMPVRRDDVEKQWLLSSMQYENVRQPVGYTKLVSR